VPGQGCVSAHTRAAVGSCRTAVAGGEALLLRPLPVFPVLVTALNRYVFYSGNSVLQKAVALLSKPRQAQCFTVS